MEKIKQCYLCENKFINTNNKCQLCLYEKIGSIMMCPKCKSVVREEDTFSAEIVISKIPKYHDELYSNLPFSN